jgi:hypothetical protein
MVWRSAGPLSKLAIAVVTELGVTLDQRLVIEKSLCIS